MLTLILGQKERVNQVREGGIKVLDRRSMQRSWSWKECGEFKLREGLLGGTGNERERVCGGQETRPRRAWRAVILLWLLS